MKKLRLSKFTCMEGGRADIRIPRLSNWLLTAASSISSRVFFSACFTGHYARAWHMHSKLYKALAWHLTSCCCYRYSHRAPLMVVLMANHTLCSFLITLMSFIIYGHFGTKTAWYCRLLWITSVCWHLGVLWASEVLPQLCFLSSPG